MKFLKDQSGLTLIEMMLVVGILALLFAIGVVSLSTIQIVTTSTSATTVLISDLKTQQVKAMVGDTEGRGVPDNYGIKILSDQYILFHGNSYNPSDSSNFSVPVPETYTLSTTFPNSTLLFASDSGELVNFTTGLDTVTLTNTTSSKTEVIKLNKYGTVTDFE